jgi:glutamate formiminotransferase/formiminotetrahydrofolate cyclodeaminase
MVANLSARKRGWEDRMDFFVDWAVKGEDGRKKLLHYVDEDTRAFNSLMEAFRLPKESDAEKKTRQEAIEKATAERLLTRLERIEAGEQGWQGTAWALERIYPHRFARPEVMN